MAQDMLGRMWIVVCIRKCVGGRRIEGGRCIGEAGAVLVADVLVEMASCL